MSLYEEYKDDLEAYKRKHPFSTCCRTNEEIMNQICKKDINFFSLRYTSIEDKHKTYDVSLYAISRQGYLLAYVDKKQQTPIMCQIAVLDYKSAIEYVRCDLVTKELLSLLKLDEDHRKYLRRKIIKLHVN